MTGEDGLFIHLPRHLADPSTPQVLCLPIMASEAIGNDSNFSLFRADILGTHVVELAPVAFTHLLNIVTRIYA